MSFYRIVVSDLHLGTGVRRGELNPFEDFFHDDRFVELIRHYDGLAGPQGEVELVLNGDVFDLLKVRIGGVWPTEITEEIAVTKLRACIEGHPHFVQGLREFVEKRGRRITYLPGNHDLDMWFHGAQELFKRYVAPGEAADRVRFITSTDTYYLPEGIQIRHGHQLERIHRVDYARILRERRDGPPILDLPWGSLWILEVMNPAKERRQHVDRVQPLKRYLLGALFFDTRFALRFIFRSIAHFLRRRVFTIRAWTQRIASLPRLLREEIFALGGYDAAAIRALQRMRGVHTLIVGHSHGPRYRSLPGGKMLVNTGTWMPMINLDMQHLGQDSGLTYALIEYTEDGKPQTSLMRWYGVRTECEVVPYID